MIPRLAAAGTSFEGAFLYYCHDKKSLTSNRVAWTETMNMMTQTMEKAWKVMAYTAKVATQLKKAANIKRAGDKVKKPVISYSLAWHPEQKPTKATMLAAAQESIKKLGLEEHEAIIVAHTDEPQKHIHIITSQIHPRTGKAANLYKSKRKLQEWAREFQKKEGTMYCPQREENHQKRKERKPSRYGDPKLISAWENSNSGKEFQSLIEKAGYHLAQGRKRLVVIDPYGKTLNPVRQIPEINAETFNQKLSDLGHLPTPEQIIQQRASQDNEKQQANLEGQKSPQRQNEPPMKDADNSQKKPKSNFEEKADAAMKKLLHEQNTKLSEFEEKAVNQLSNYRTNLKAKLKLDERAEKIQHIRGKLNQPRLTPKWIRTLLRLDRKTIQSLEELQTKQQEALSLYSEKTNNIEIQISQKRKSFKSNQAMRRHELRQRLEKWRPKKRALKLQNSTSNSPMIEKDSPSLKM